jgi:plastocyanin
MTRIRTLGGPAALVLAVLLSGCGGGDTSPADAGSDSASSSKPSPSSGAAGRGSKSPAPKAAAVITIKDFAFDVPSGLHPGDEVMIRNEDGEAHTVTSREKGAFDVKVDGGSTAMLTVPDQAGSYDFYCIYHSNMEATLEVG